MSEKNPYTEEIMRCNSLQKFPLYAEGVKELRNALRDASGSTEIATQVIDRIMATCEICPTVKQIRLIAGEIKSETQAVPAGCEICEGQPWVSYEKILMTNLTGMKDELGRPISKPVAFAGAKRCRCAKGQWFRQKDRENEAKRAAGLPV